MVTIKKSKLKATLLRVASVALLGCMCYGNTFMEVKAVGSHKTTRTSTPMSFKKTNIPGAPKKELKRFRRLREDSRSVRNNLISLFNAESDMPERQAEFQKSGFSLLTCNSAQAPTTTSEVRSKENVLAEIKNNDRLKWLYYCQLKGNEAMQTCFIKKLRTIPFNVDKKKFVNSFLDEHPEFNGLPKPPFLSGCLNKKSSQIPEQMKTPELKRNSLKQGSGLSSEEIELLFKELKNSYEELEDSDEELEDSDEE